MRKTIFIVGLLISLIGYTRSYHPYRFLLVDGFNNRIINEDVTIIWEFNRGFVPDKYEKAPEDFFVLTVTNIYDSILYQEKTKNHQLTLSKSLLENNSSNSLFIHLGTERENISANTLHLEIMDSNDEMMAGSTIELINSMLNHGFYINAFSKIQLLDTDSSLVKSFLKNYSSLEIEWNQPYVPYPWTLNNLEGTLQFLKQPEIVNDKKIQKSVDKCFKGKAIEDQNWIMTLTLEDCFINQCQTKFSELNRLIETIRNEIKLDCINSTSEQLNILFVPNKKRGTYELITSTIKR